MSGWYSCGKVRRYYVNREVCPECGADLQPSNFGIDIDPITNKKLPKQLPSMGQDGR